MTNSATFLERPLGDVTAWTDHFVRAELPILAATAEALETFRSDEDRVDANRLGELIATDPFLTLKVMAHAARSRSPRTVTDIETVTGVLVMTGIPPFFRAFGLQPTLEDRLAEWPVAWTELQRGVRRARRAARFAIGFAAHRLDPDAAVIHAATLLHDFAELLLWCHAPAVAMRLIESRRLNPDSCESALERQVLNVALVELQLALVKAWRLPRLLVRASDQRQAGRADVRCVALADALALHSALGWNDPAVADDIAATALWLNLSPAATLELVQSM